LPSLISKDHDFADQSGTVWARRDRNPRLMPGQGAIIRDRCDRLIRRNIAAFPTTRTRHWESQGDDGDVHLRHRVIQGAESARFWQAAITAGGRARLLRRYFSRSKIALQPMRWEADLATAPVINADPMKQAASRD